MTRTEAARRELETKLLPALAPPKPSPPSHRRVWLLILLVALLVFAGWRWLDVIISLDSLIPKNYYIIFDGRILRLAG